MTTSAMRMRAVRRQSRYTTTFRNFNAAERRKELAELKKLYEKDRLSIRRIAAVKASTYCFIRARLLDAGVDINANQRGKRSESRDSAEQSRPTVLESHHNSQ